MYSTTPKSVKTTTGVQFANGKQGTLQYFGGSISSIAIMKSNTSGTISYTMAKYPLIAFALIVLCCSGVNADSDFVCSGSSSGFLTTNISSCDSEDSSTFKLFETNMALFISCGGSLGGGWKYVTAECHEVDQLNDATGSHFVCTEREDLQIANCTEANVAAVEYWIRVNEEDNLHLVVYVVVALIALAFIGCMAYGSRGSDWSEHFWELVVPLVLRFFDFASDWAFFAISLAPSSIFSETFDGDFNAMRYSTLTFCIIGSILFLPDCFQFAISFAAKVEEKEAGMFPVKDEDSTEDTSSEITILLLVIFLEDLPFIIINIFYLNSTGGLNSQIAIFALVMSILSIVLELFRLCNSRGAKKYFCGCFAKVEQDNSSNVNNDVNRGFNPNHYPRNWPRRNFQDLL